VPFNDLAVRRFQHTGESGLNIVDELIDDIVVADIDAFFLRQAQSSPIGLDVKADDDGSRGGSEVNVGFVDVPDAFVNKAYLDILLANFRQCIFDGLS